MRRLDHFYDGNKSTTETVPEEETPDVGWPVWFQWVLVSTLGWILGLALGGELGVGTGVGVMQWLVLRRHVPQAGWWIVASTVGWTAGWAVVVTGIVVPPGAGFFGELLTGAMLGAMLGIAQWVVLRRLVYQAGWWIVISTISWTVALSGLMGFTVVGAIAGAATGLVLIWLLRQPRPTVRILS